MNRCLRISLFSVFAGALYQAAHGAQGGTDIDWNALGNDAVTVLSQYLQVDTSNPPGNEMEAARFLKALFDKEGIENKVFESEPGRASIYARLKGDGSKKAVVLLNHLDVVPVDRRYWTVEPFGGAIKDGYIWGRGAIDMKSMGVVEAMAMLTLKRQSITPKGDVIFLGVADEEEGGIKGAGYVVKEHFDLFKDAGLVINEFGTIFTLDDGKTLFYGIATAEKSPLWLKLTAMGIPGHGSTPRPDSAANKIVRALDRIVNYQTPFKVTPDVQQFYTATAGRSNERFKDLRSSLQDPGFATEFTRDLLNNAAVRNTISVTVIEASNKANVISTEASAKLDIRLLPGEDPGAVIAELKKVIADESIKVETILSFVAGSSPAGNQFFQVVTDIAEKQDPGVPVTPFQLNGFTDCHFFREKGIPCYGFMPFKLTGREVSRMHGNDERISVDNMKDGTRLMYEIVRKLAAD